MASELEQEHDYDLHDVGEGEEGVSGLLDAQLIGSARVADEENEEEVEADVPIKELEVCWVLEEELADEGA